MRVHVPLWKTCARLLSVSKNQLPLSWKTNRTLYMFWTQVLSQICLVNFFPSLWLWLLIFLMASSEKHSYSIKKNFFFSDGVLTLSWVLRNHCIPSKKPLFPGSQGWSPVFPSKSCIMSMLTLRPPIHLRFSCTVRGRDGDPFLSGIFRSFGTTAWKLSSSHWIT